MEDCNTFVRRTTDIEMLKHTVNYLRQKTYLRVHCDYLHKSLQSKLKIVKYLTSK